MSILEQLQGVYIGKIEQVFPSLYSWQYDSMDILIKVDAKTGEVYTKFRLAPETDWVKDCWKIK